MKRLTENQIKMVRGIEKEEGTYEPKNIWVRAWQIMLENHLAELSNRMKKMKIVCWKSKTTNAKGRGTVALSDDIAEKWVDELNKKYPELYHWTEEVKENENSTDKC